MLRISWTDHDRSTESALNEIGADREFLATLEETEAVLLRQFSSSPAEIAGD